MPESEQELFDGIKHDDAQMGDDAFAGMLDKPKAEQAETQVKSEQDEDSPKNRREHRLQAKLQAERENNIALNERLKAMAELKEEAKQAAEQGEDPDLVRLLGNEPNGKLAQEIFSKKFREIEDRAFQRARSEIENDRQSIAQEEAQNSSEIDNGFDFIEDEYGVDLSGNTKASKDLRNGFIDFVANISPKDDNGEIVEYADFDSAFKTYQQLSSRTKPHEVSERQKQLGSRSMQESGGRVDTAPRGPITFKSAARYIDSLRDQD